MLTKQILFIAAFSFWLRGSSAQDKVYMLNGDSVSASILANPRKESDLSDLAIGRLNDYGFKSMVAVYKKDSIRIVRPGDIKGYFRQEKGDYLGAGYFFSRTINERQLGYKQDNTRAVFLQRVNYHKQIIIWFYRQDIGRPMPDCYFLIEIKGRGITDCITSFEEWKKWSVNYPPLGELTFEKGKPPKGKSREGNLFKYLVELMEEYKKRYP